MNCLVKCQCSASLFNAIITISYEKCCLYKHPKVCTITFCTFTFNRFDVWAPLLVQYFKYFIMCPFFIAVLIYTGPLVTQSASIIYAITRLALVSMRQMLEGIV